MSRTGGLGRGHCAVMMQPRAPGEAKVGVWDAIRKVI